MNPEIAAPLPWHSAAVRGLDSAWIQQRWPHALLIHGAEGLGKSLLARWLAKSVLCERTKGGLRPCGECGSCTLFESNTHPDLRIIAPEEDKQSISVEQIRDACGHLAMTSYRQGFKVTIVNPAHQMTTAAANGLLKTLEEPAARTLLILLTSRPGALLPTIRSRCQQLGLRAPGQREALSWLAETAQTSVGADVLRFANGAPLKALELARGRYSTLWGEMIAALDALFSRRTDVTQIAKQWANDEVSDRLLCLDHWLMQQIRKSLGQTDEFVTSAVLPRDAQVLNISRVFACLDRVRELRAVLGRTALQKELALEGVLLALMETFSYQRERVFDNKT